MVHHFLLTHFFLLPYTPLTMPYSEQEPTSSIYQSNHFEAEISDTAETFMAKVTNGAETVIFRYTPPGQVSFELQYGESVATSSLPSPHEYTPAPEIEKVVKIYGRTATEVFSATAPSGEAMVIVSFAEHPSWNKDSLGNTELDKVKKDTRYWQVAAFGTNTPLLEGVPKGKAMVMIGYPKDITKKGKSGQDETVKNGFHLVNTKPYLGTPKPRTSSR